MVARTIAVTGPPGSGKTTTGLLFAYILNVLVSEEDYERRYHELSEVLGY